MARTATATTTTSDMNTKFQRQHFDWALTDNNNNKIIDIFLDQKSLSMRHQKNQRQQASEDRGKPATNNLDSLHENLSSFFDGSFHQKIKRLPSEEESEHEQQGAELALCRRRRRRSGASPSSSPSNNMTNDPSLSSSSSSSSSRIRIAERKDPKLISSFILISLLVCSILVIHKTLPIQLASGLEVPTASTASPTSPLSAAAAAFVANRQDNSEANSNQVSELTITTINDQEQQQHANKREQLQLAPAERVASEQQQHRQQHHQVAATQQSSDNKKLINNEDDCPECGQSIEKKKKKANKKSADDKPVRRAKRHLAAESKAQPPAASAGNRPDCHKLTVFWLFLQSNYPALSRHLLDWSTAPIEQQSDEQFLWSKTSQIARTLGRLLEEAERIVASEHQQQTTNHQHSGGWLARVSSKQPTYARFMQHLRAKQHQQQQPANFGRQVETTTAPVVTTTAAAAATTDSRPAPAQITYGKLINYPHEIGDTSNSLGMARTLAKLRILNRHNKNMADEMERQQQAGDANSILETNRIPIPIISDEELDGETNWRRALELADEARSKVVYGNVILQPQKQGDNGQRHQNTLNKLHELASREQSMSNSNNNNHRNHHETTVDANGRINRVSTLSRLKQQLDSGLQASQQHRTPAGSNKQSLPTTTGGEQYTNEGDFISNQMMPADELINQQRSQQMSAFGGEQVFASEEEFEGDFHTGPLQKAPEVRQLRSVVLSKNTRTSEQKRSDNGNEQSKDTEVIPNSNGVFVVD